MWLAGIAMLTVPMVTLIDIPIARWFDNNPLPREVGSMLNLMLFFSHGTGIFLILIGILMLAPRCRWRIPRLATLAMGSGAVATIVKMFVLRPRPNVLNLDIGNYDLAMLWKFDWALEQVATFSASTRAFPSGSTATATALAVGLWVVLPRGRWLFATLCLGTFLQRIYCGAHFLSDLFGGTAIGLMWAYTCFHPGLLGSLFDKMEPETKVRIQMADPSSTGTPEQASDKRAA
jgi:membrane-associated phospholipid phosphatase